ncbi:MAG: lipoyl(octanoyl) transferase LipB [bacterium]|nr:MAG: lipoyl(octanoyl) transferase LipB [bacterium]
MTNTGEKIFQAMEQHFAFERSTFAVNLGITSLLEADRLMQKLTQWRRKAQISDTLLLLSHPPSLAAGAKELNPADLLMPLSYFEKQGIYLYKNIRGGGLTYNWDGQLVCYPVLKLQSHEQNIGNYMYRLEEVGLRTLKDLGIVAERKREKAAQIGLWLGNNKIASMGIHVSKWITSWGFALNLYGDKSPADFIRPCGLEGVNLITVEDVMGFKPSKKSVTERVVYHFGKVFERDIRFQLDFKSNNIKKIPETANYTNYRNYANL